MKVRISLFVLFSFIWSLSLAQGKKGFVGVAIGTSHILTDERGDATVGVNLNLINAGYEIKKGFGVAFKWMGSGHNMPDGSRLGYGGLLIGPMYTLHLSEGLLLDFKFQPGYTWVIEKFGNALRSTNAGDPLLQSEGKASATGIGFSSGLSLRYNFAKSWTVMLLSDYNTARAQGYAIRGNRLQTLSINAGIGFRI